MIAFDSDILTLIWEKVEPYCSKADQIPLADRGIPVVAAEEVLRGRLNQIRKSEAGRFKITLPAAYAFFEFTLSALRGGTYLPFTSGAEQLVGSFRSAKISVKAMDMRIAAIAIANNATLVTRNARDFRLIPGLQLDVWT